jgi:hypothetical protein
MTDSQDAFSELLATLREVGDRFAGSEWGLTDPTDVAEGLRVVLHHLGTGIETQLEEDAAHPVFREIVVPWRKALGDNADARYHDAKIHPAGTYRVRGRTEGAVYVSFTVEAGADDGAFPSGTVGVLNDSGFDVDAEGRFELTVGGPARERGWLPLADEASRITVRHYWEQAESPHMPPAPSLGLTIDLVDGDVPSTPPAPTDASVASSLRRMARYVRSRTIETMAKPGEAEAPAFVSPRATRLPRARQARHPCPRRRRRGVLDGAVPPRAGRRAPDAAALAGLPVRQRVPLEPPAPDVRLPPRPSEPEPSPSGRRVGRHRAGGDRAPRPGRPQLAHHRGPSLRDGVLAVLPARGSDRHADRRGRPRRLVALTRQVDSLA